MDKLHSQLPQPLKRCSPSRNGDLLTQIKNSNSPVSNRSPARRVVTSSPNSIRSRDTAAATSIPKQQPEVKARSPEVPDRPRDTAATPTRRPKYSQAVNGNSSPLARNKISRQQHGVEAAADTKQPPVKSLMARMPVKTKSAQLRTLRSPNTDSNHRYDDENDEKYEGGVSEPLWTPNTRPSGSGILSNVRKGLSPKFERRGDSKKVERERQQLENAEEEEDKNNGSGSPIYHELDPPGTCRFQVPHTYQSIVEISDELESLRSASTKQQHEKPTDGVASRLMSRAKSVQELQTQKSPTRLSLFSRFRFAAKKPSTKTSSAKVERTAVSPPEVRGQRSLQDVDLIPRSREEVAHGTASWHDRQPSFSTFAHRVPRGSSAAAAATCDGDGYSCVYVPQRSPERSSTTAVPVPPRSSSLNPGRTNPVAEPLYKQKFLKIARVHTLQSCTSVDDRDCRPSLTSSNSVGDLLLATDIGKHSPRPVTSYDDHAVETGSRKTTAAATSGSKQSYLKSQIARFGLSPGRGAASFASPSCGIRMAEMRVAVRRCTNDVSTSPTRPSSRSPSASTPVPSPARLSVFQFSVPPAGVMTSPPVQRAYRHVSSQTVTSVRPPSANCVLAVTAVHGPSGGPVGQMQTIEEEDDCTNDDPQSASRAAETADQQDDNVMDKTRPNVIPAARTLVSDNAEQSRSTVAGRKCAEDDCRTSDDHTAHQRTQSEVSSVVSSKTSKLRRPATSVAAKPVAYGSGSPLLDHHPSRIVPPSVATHKHSESSGTSPPGTPRSAVDSPIRSGSGRGELVRRQFGRGQQQQRKTVAPLADGDTATAVGQIGDGLSVPGVHGPTCARRLLQTPAAAASDGASSAAASPNLSSGSSVSLLSTGSEADVLAGPAAPDPSSSADVTTRTSPADTRPTHHKHSASSSLASRVGKLNELTIPARTDRANY